MPIIAGCQQHPLGWASFGNPIWYLAAPAMIGMALAARRRIAEQMRDD